MITKSFAWLEERIASAAVTLAELEAERTTFLQLSSLYPDLHTFIGTEGRIFQSEAANPHVTHADFRYGCSCCDDAALKVSLYLETQPASPTPVPGSPMALPIAGK